MRRAALEPRATVPDEVPDGCKTTTGPVAGGRGAARRGGRRHRGGRAARRRIPRVARPPGNPLHRRAGRRRRRGAQPEAGGRRGRSDVRGPERLPPFGAGRAGRAGRVAGGGLLAHEQPGRPHHVGQPAGNLLQRHGGRRLGARRRAAGGRGPGSASGRDLLRAPAGAGRRAAVHAQRPLPGLPPVVGHARGAGAAGAEHGAAPGRSECLRDRLRHRPPKPPGRPLGRVVRHRDARRDGAHGERRGPRRAGPERHVRRRPCCARLARGTHRPRRLPVSLQRRGGAPWCSITRRT